MNEYLNHPKDLALLISQGNERAFELLFEQWWDKVYSTALIFSKSTALSQDIAQEVFLELWRQRASLAGVDNLPGYLMGIARNMIFRKLSRIDLETNYKNYVSARAIHLENSAEQNLLSKELQNAISQAISLLPQQQQQAFRLSRQQGLSHEEIAQKMGISRLTVKDYIVKAIAFLRKYLRQHGLPAIFIFFWGKHFLLLLSCNYIIV